MINEDSETKPCPITSRMKPPSPDKMRFAEEILGMGLRMLNATVEDKDGWETLVQVMLTELAVMGAA